MTKTLHLIDASLYIFRAWHSLPNEFTDVDGAPLMQSVFSVNNPVLAFNGLADQSDRDEQQGMMQLYAGAVMAIRNPGGHRVAVIEQPDRALQHLELLSYLAYRLDEAKKVR